MAHKQTRRSISIRGTTYDALRECCVKENRSMSDVVEELLAAWFADRGVTAAPAAAPKAARVKSTDRRGFDIRSVEPARAQAAVAPRMLRAKAPQPVLPKPLVSRIPPAVLPPKPNTTGKSFSEARPAPAKAEIPTRVKAPKGDYRTLRF